MVYGSNESFIVIYQLTIRPIFTVNVSFVYRKINCPHIKSSYEGSLKDYYLCSIISLLLAFTCATQDFHLVL